MAVTAEQLNILLSARDKEFTKAMDRSQRRVEQFAKRSERNLSRTSRGFSAMSKAAKLAGAALAAAFSVNAVRGIIASTANISRMASIAGVSAEELQRFAAAARTVGIEQDKVSDILKDVNDKIGDFLATGAGPMKDFFENIAPLVGVTADQFRNLNSADALQLYVSSLEKANLSQAEMTFYMEALANDATALIPLLRNSGQEMQRLGDEAARTGQIIDNETIESTRELDRKLDDISRTLRTKAARAVVEYSDELEIAADFIIDDLIPAMGRIFSAAKSFADGIKPAITALGDFIGAAAPALRAMGLMREEMGGAGLSLEAQDWLQGVTNQMSREGDPDVSRTGTWGVEGDASGAGPLRMTITPPATTTDTAATGGGSRVVDQTEEIARAYDSLLRSLDPIASAHIDYAEALHTVNNALNAGVISQEQATYMIGLAREEMRGLTSETIELGNVADRLRTGFEDVFMSIVDGTIDGKDAFKAMARDVIRELYRVLVVQQMVGQFQSGGGGILGAAFGALTGRASGGSVMAGQPYMVGESGPEPFVPAQNGRILSTAQAKDAMSGGGGGVTIIQNNTFGSGVTRQDVAAMLPKMVDATKRAVIDSQRRSVNGRPA